MHILSPHGSMQEKGVRDEFEGAHPVRSVAAVYVVCILVRLCTPQCGRERWRRLGCASICSWCDRSAWICYVGWISWRPNSGGGSRNCLAAGCCRIPIDGCRALPCGHHRVYGADGRTAPGACGAVSLCRAGLKGQTGASMAHRTVCRFGARRASPIAAKRALGRGSTMRMSSPVSSRSSATVTSSRKSVPSRRQISGR